MFQFNVSASFYLLNESNIDFTLSKALLNCFNDATTKWNKLHWHCMRTLKETSILLKWTSTLTLSYNFTKNIIFSQIVTLSIVFVHWWIWLARDCSLDCVQMQETVRKFLPFNFPSLGFKEWLFLCDKFD